tara:strand:+ start:8800 stop:9015 length:216 start_codon:yes stop_codon:yes gene_type:complete
MNYTDLFTAVLSFTALLLIRQIVLVPRRINEGPEEDEYTGRALDPESLSRVDEESMRDFDRLLGNRFPEEE